MNRIFDTLSPRDIELIGKMHEAHREYIESIRENIPENVYAYAVSEDRFTLSGANGVHDSWLLEVAFFPKLKIILLGPFWDRTIEFSYDGVISFALEKNNNEMRGDTLLGDFLVDDITLEDGFLLHEIRFSKGSLRVLATAFDCSHGLGQHFKYGVAEHLGR